MANALTMLLLATLACQVLWLLRQDAETVRSCRAVCGYLAAFRQGLRRGSLPVRLLSQCPDAVHRVPFAKAPGLWTVLLQAVSCGNISSAGLGIAVRQCRVSLASQARHSALVRLAAYRAGSAAILVLGVRTAASLHGMVATVASDNTVVALLHLVTGVLVLELVQPDWFWRGCRGRPEIPRFSGIPAGLTPAGTTWLALVLGLTSRAMAEYAQPLPGMGRAVVATAGAEGVRSMCQAWAEDMNQMRKSRLRLASELRPLWDLIFIGGGLLLGLVDLAGEVF